MAKTLFLRVFLHNFCLQNIFLKNLQIANFYAKIKLLG